MGLSFFRAIFFKFSPILKFTIKEQSMMPTLNPGDLVLIEKASLLFRKPNRGEVVVFKLDNKYLIKRIQTINDRQYFVIGDNSTKSYDSRNFGKISKKEIVGRAFYVIK